MFTVLETVIERLYLFMCNLLRYLSYLTPKMVLNWDCRRIRNVLRRWLILICWEDTKGSSFKIEPCIALDSLYSLYIFAGHNFTSYFRSAANRINVFILGNVWVAFSQPIP